MSFDPLDAALGELRRAGADYGDARLVSDEREAIHVRFEEVETLQRGRSRGLGVRALWGGAWGFAARPDTDEASAVQAARDAVEVARAAAQVSAHRVSLVEEEPGRGQWANPVAVDPFALPLERKVA
ncbi:MAG TPA: DNA gyrase modulator, partial [Polyangia bacterium]|nr:DNA gyrase modulator [Polyangia bacterium]